MHMLSLRRLLCDPGRLCPEAPPWAVRAASISVTERPRKHAQAWGLSLSTTPAPRTKHFQSSVRVTRGKVQVCGHFYLQKWQFHMAQPEERGQRPRENMRSPRSRMELAACALWASS